MIPCRTLNHKVQKKDWPRLSRHHAESGLFYFRLLPVFKVRLCSWIQSPVPNSECLFWQVILKDCHERKYYKLVLTENLEVLYWKKNLKLSHSRSSGIVRFDFIPDNQHLTIRVSVKKVNLRCVESYLPYSISPLFYECRSNYFISKIAHRHSCTGTVSAASLYQRNWLMRNKIIVNIQILKTTFFYPVEKPKPKINQFLYLKA